jgi:hypothetical protein
MTFTQERLQKLFDYKDGNLYWKQTKGRILAGSIAGTKSHHYWQVCIDYVIYRNHRLIWTYHHGTNPKNIDHVNGDTFDNRIENLRECNKSENQHNRKLNKNNSSGVKGVSWSKQKKKWRARVNLDGTDAHVGFFDSLQEAKESVEKARTKLHNAFFNHG